MPDMSSGHPHAGPFVHQIETPSDYHGVTLEPILGSALIGTCEVEYETCCDRRNDLVSRWRGRLYSRAALTDEASAQRSRNHHTWPRWRGCSASGRLARDARRTTTGNRRHDPERRR